MKGHALIVSVPKVKKAHYGVDHYLPGAKEDLEEMCSLLEQTGLYKGDIKALKGPEATWKNLQGHLKDLRESFTQEDAFLLLYISSHGAFLEYENYRCELLCLYDQIIMEQQLQEQLSQFKNNFRVAVIVDSCYSGGLAGLKLRNEDLSKIKALKDYELIDAINDNEAFYLQLVDSYAGQVFNFQTEVCFLFACEAHQTAIIGAEGRPSLFTAQLLDTWASGKFNGNYHSFSHSIKRELPSAHSPRIIVNNPHKPSHYQNYTPFLYNTPATGPKADEERYWIIDTTEVKGKHVEVVLEAQPEEEFSLVIEKTYDLENEPIQLIPVIEYLNNIGYEDRFVNVVELKKDNSGSKIITFTCDRLKSEEPNEQSNGIVLVYNHTNNSVEGHERTKGKVSNNIGGGGTRIRRGEVERVQNN